MLATSPEPALRNKEEALTLSEKACALSQYQEPSALDTLATVYAVHSRFDKAYQTATNAIRIAESQKNTPMAEAIRLRADLFKEKKVYVEE